MVPSAAEEAEFMANLLRGLDNSFGDTVSVPTTNSSSPPPPQTPSKRSPISPKQKTSHNAVSKDGDFDMEAFFEGSETWDLDDYSLSPIKPNKPTKYPSSPKMLPYVPDECTRCIAVSIIEEHVESQWRKSITARVEATEERVHVYLYDDWYLTDIRVDDSFNILGSFSLPTSPTSSSPPQCRYISITSQTNLLTLHPDILLTATALSNAPQCRRKPLLSSLVRSTSDITPALVWGSMLHEVMQKCLVERSWDEAFLEKCVDEAVVDRLGDLVKIGLEQDVAKREIMDRAKGLGVFRDRYLTDVPKNDAKLMNTRSKAFEEPSLLAITKVLDVEEDIWSPTYGLKGKLDVTVQGIISDPIPSCSTTYAANSSRPLPPRQLIHTPLPLELKTGRAQAGLEHRAQTMLYTLLLSERYAADVQDGLLFYTQSEGEEVVRVPRGRNEIRGLIGVRNEIAGYIWRRTRGRKKGDKKDRMDVAGEVNDVVDREEEEPFLPPPIDDERVCKRCYVQDTCFLFRKTHPNHSSSAEKKKMKFDPPIPAFLAGIFEAKTGHLTPSQIQFFRDWELLLSLEERDLVRFKRELWTLGAAEREKRGRCFAGMVLVQSDRERNQGKSLARVMIDAGVTDVEEEHQARHVETKIHRYTYTFRRSTESALPLSSPPSSQINQAQSLLNGHLNVGDPITVSAEPLLALARGYILELTPSEVVVGVDHVLDLDAIQNRLKRGSSAFKSQPFSGNDEVIFRIDKDELFGGMARVRNNLAQLFYADGDRRRLELVVDLRKPTFSEPDPPFVLSSSSLRSSKMNLNPCQLAAMEKVLSAQDYALVLGMPGTGKTTVVAALIRELVGRGKTVLLTSYTHSAVDTILMKLAGDGGGREADFEILRLGNVDKVHPDMRKYTPNARSSASTVKEFETLIMSPPVVATTCLSVDHPLFSRRNFDYCIVDEASQITLPTCLGPLKFADKFILVGDHYQLPPVVRNSDARKGGLDVSLFRRLSEAHPEAVVDLRLQYRMNADIMLLSNKLIYDNRLSCGSEEVANRSLTLRHTKFLTSLHPAGTPRHCGTNCWFETLVSESRKAVFVDTDALPALDSRVGDLVQNVTEAELVRQLTETFIRSGVEESRIGIISLYRQQVKLLQHSLRDRRGVEILTADRSQGRDKDCIIISFVRSNEEGNIGDLVKDWRRMNVSFTRARSKLVLFGSRKTLQREPLLAQFFGLMEEQGWIFQLPPGSESVHAKAFETTVAQPSKQQATIKAGQKRRHAGKENTAVKMEQPNQRKELPPPAKKARLEKKVNGDARTGLLNGRPILQDLVVNEV